MRERRVEGRDGKGGRERGRQTGRRREKEDGIRGREVAVR